MAPTPFAGLRPASDDAHARWIVAALVRPWPVTVGFRVPRGYEAVVRIHHRLDGHESWSTLLPEASFEAGAPWPPYNAHEPGPVEGSVRDQLLQVEGEFGDADVDLLAETLAQATGDDRVHIALWEGWGWLHPGAHTVTVFASGPDPQLAQRDADREHAALMQPAYDFVARCPTVDWWGGRPMILFDGRLGDLPSIGSPWRSSLARQSPQWWWPPDRSWFVATEIDDPCTYVAGPAWLIERVEALGFETVRVADTDPW